MKLIITFPYMEAEVDMAGRAPQFGEPAFSEWSLADHDAAHQRHMDAFSRMYTAEHKAMEILEETALALAMARVRRKCGLHDYYSDHIGLAADYNTVKGGFEIEVWRLFPELLAVLEDLCALGSFNMRFETDAGNSVPNDWWRPTDDDSFFWHIYDPDTDEVDSYMTQKEKKAETKANLAALSLTEPYTTKTA